MFYAYGKENIKITETLRYITRSPKDNDNYNYNNNNDNDNNNNNNLRHNETGHKLTRVAVDNIPISIKITWGKNQT